MKQGILIFVFSLCISTVSAQNKEGKNFVYYKEFSVGVGVHTSGLQILADYNIIRDARTKLLLEFEVSQMKHPKEYRQTQDFPYTLVGVNSPKPFVFGKQNSFLLLNASIGKEKEIGRKAQKSGVSISIKYLAGVSLGILKPYYLNLLYPTDNSFTIEPTRYSEESKDRYLERNFIYGGTGNLFGIGESRFIPGVNCKVALVFDWANYDEVVKVLETGVMFNAFYKDVPIMILEKNQQFYPNIYAAIRIGKRW